MSKILILCGEGYGNLVMTTPLMRACMDMGHDVHALVECNWPDAHTLIDDCGLAGVYSGREACAGIRFDLAIGTVWNGNMTGIDAGDFILLPRPTDAARHEADVNLDAARQLGWSGETPQPFCSAPLKTFIPGRICFCMGYGGHSRAEWARKAWPGWRALYNRLERRKILSVGMPRDRVDWMPSEQQIIHTAISGSASVLQSAEWVIAIDNGLAHIAAALGVKTIVMFGATSEVKNAPGGANVHIVAADMPCRPCQMTDRWAQCSDFQCMSAISTDRIARLICA